MARNYIQEGDVMDYVNKTEAAILSGAVVLFANSIGVAMVDIPSLGVGAVALEGVWSLPKAAGENLAQGAFVYWSEDGITATAGAIKAGLVFADAAAADATVSVRLPY